MKIPYFVWSFLDDTKGVSTKGESQDPYFKMSDPANEHERFKEAQQRLEKRHRAKINKVAILEVLWRCFCNFKEENFCLVIEPIRDVLNHFRKSCFIVYIGRLPRIVDTFL